MSVLVLCAALGSGMAFAVLPLADLHTSAWRIVYLVPLAGLAVVVWVGAGCPRAALRVRASGRGSHDGNLVDRQADPEVAARRRRRLALLAASAFLIAMFAAPASGCATTS